MADSPSPPNEMADSPSPPTKTTEEKRKSSIFRRSAKSKSLEGNTEVDGVKNLQEKPLKNKQSLKKKHEKALNSLLKDEEPKNEENLQIGNNLFTNDFSCGEKNTELGETQEENIEQPAVGEEKKTRKKSFIKRIIEYKKLMKDQIKEEKESNETNKKSDLQNEILSNKLKETEKNERSSECLDLEENISADCNPISECSEDSFQDALQNVEEDCNTERSVNNEANKHEKIFKDKEIKSGTQPNLIFDEFNLTTVSEITTITLTQTDIVTDIATYEIEKIEHNELESEKYKNLSKCNSKNDVCILDNQLIEQNSLATNEHEITIKHEIENTQGTQVCQNTEEKLINKNEFSITCESITLTPIKSNTINYVVVDKPPEGSKIDESFFAKKALKVYQKANLSRTYCQSCCSMM